VAGFLLLLWVALWIAGFVDALTTDASRVRLMPKIVWVILILLFGGFGSLAWFFLGRPRGTGVTRSRSFGGFGAFGPPPGSSSHPSMFGRTDKPGRAAPETLGGWQLGGAGRRSGPIAPDDDPEFLRQIGKPRANGTDGDAKPDQPA
jgi:hypothetical protein